jgi:hypothetical protein
MHIKNQRGRKGGKGGGRERKGISMIGSSLWGVF